VTFIREWEDNIKYGGTTLYNKEWCDRFGGYSSDQERAHW